jgi:arginyl-tRNA synthetase
MKRLKKRRVLSAQTSAVGDTVYNVIDSRQSYPQEIVAQGVAAVVPEVGREASVHFSYEMVALSPAACEALGIELTDEDRARPYIEMSGRKGLGVKADDLINQLQAGALLEVEKRNPEVTGLRKESSGTTNCRSGSPIFSFKVYA